MRGRHCGAIGASYPAVLRLFLRADIFERRSDALIMATIIDINVSIDELEERKERVTRAKSFGTPDRVPVVPALAHRFLVPMVGVRFRDYYRDPEVMLRTQILAQKWLMENIRTDAYSIT